MAIISFYSSCMQETGNTISAIAYASYLGMTKNKKILLVSTGLNDNTAVESLWPQEQNKKSGLFGPNTSSMAQNGIEELDRIVRSNRTTSEIITDYTRVALKDRLEVLTNYIGEKKVFAEIQKNYAQIISLAGRAYETVIVDIDQNLSKEVQNEILQVSDVILATTTQKLSNIEKLDEEIQNQENTILDKSKTLIVLGKYDNSSKYNAKNISRTLLKQKDVVNTIPYNHLLLEGAQEGRLIENIDFLRKIKNRDENSLVIEELKRLDEKIENKVMEQQMRRR